MDIVSIYRQNFNDYLPGNSDFNLIECDNDIFVGVDKNGNTCVVVNARDCHNSSFQQKTKMLCVQFNIAVECIIEQEYMQTHAHVFRCYSRDPNEIDIFLELTTGLLLSKGCGEEEIRSIFTVLTNFFSNQQEITNSELIGLYGELYAIKVFNNSLGLYRYWQSRDRMKFDFSFSDGLKLEVKSTTKNTRSHHFRHEQLTTTLYDIYVMSFMFREDDAGLSLAQLIEEVKSILANDINKTIRLNLIKKNAGIERLEALKFSEEYTDEKRHIYKAEDLPKFNEITPEGVVNAEYDCDLENIAYISDDDFIKKVKETFIVD